MAERLNINTAPRERNEPQHAFLIVNADDYGYSDGVSRGILEGALQGVVTATGILANSRFFDEHVEKLLSVECVDAGVHLNLTRGRPLTNGLAGILERTRGEFPENKFDLALSVLAGKITLRMIEEEWDAQIRRCRDANVRIWFLNSHEHLHMLPPLFRLIHRLADLHGIPYIRHTAAEWFHPAQYGSIPREVILHLLDWVDRCVAGRKGPTLLGVSPSGRITLHYLERRVAALRRGGVYELMCHPGRPVAGEVTDRRLLTYHDWEGELDSLLRAKESGLFDSGSVRLTRYRDLDGTGTRKEKAGA